MRDYGTQMVFMDASYKGLWSHCWEMKTQGSLFDFSDNSIHYIVFYCDNLLCVYIFSCDQAALWNVCLSVCLSHLFDNVPDIVSSWNFHSDYHLQEWGRCTNSRSEIKGEGERGHGRFQTITPLWNHEWLRNLELAYYMCAVVFQCHASNFKVRRDKTPVLTQIERFRSDCQGHLSNVEGHREPNICQYVLNFRIQDY